MSAVAGAAAASVPGLPPDWRRWQNTQLSVLRGVPGLVVGHVFLRVSTGQALPARRLLAHLSSIVAGADRPSPRKEVREPVFQVGLSFEGLQCLACEPSAISQSLLDDLARKAPGFAMGADLRAPRLGDIGRSAPQRWDPSFTWRPHLVLSVYGQDEQAIDDALSSLPVDLLQHWEAYARPPSSRRAKVWPAEWASAAALTGSAPDRDGARGVGIPIPLGLKDGVTQLRIEGVPPSDARPMPPAHLKPYPVGEFLLGHDNLDGANVWGVAETAGKPAHPLWKDASFAVLRKMELDTLRWEQYLGQAAAVYGKRREEVAAKLLGRGVDGRPLSPEGMTVGNDTSTWDNFAFNTDGQGSNCPFGSHIRRMNPRGDTSLVALRARPILRRGLPYRQDASMGLMGLFFCASLEEQFEHLLAQWARRNPMGSGNRGAALDPFAPGDMDGRPFDIPGWEVQSGLTPPALPNVAVTRGSVYLFYPSRAGIAWLAQ